MWLLLFSVLLASGEAQSTIKLEQYSSLEECMSEAHRIRDEMLKAYPNDGRLMQLRCVKRTEVLL